MQKEAAGNTEMSGKHPGRIALEFMQMVALSGQAVPWVGLQLGKAPKAELRSAFSLVVLSAPEQVPMTLMRYFVSRILLSLELPHLSLMTTLQDTHCFYNSVLQIRKLRVDATAPRLGELVRGEQQAVPAHLRPEVTAAVLSLLTHKSKLCLGKSRQNTRKGRDEERKARAGSATGKGDPDGRKRIPAATVTACPGEEVWGQRQRRAPEPPGLEREGALLRRWVAGTPGASGHGTDEATTGTAGQRNHRRTAPRGDLGCSAAPLHMRTESGWPGSLSPRPVRLSSPTYALHACSLKGTFGS